LKAHTPRRRFGQNFLVDRSYIDRIIQAVDPQPEDHAVEIGPGLGALTGPLIERLSVLHVIEIDRDIVARLLSEFPPERLTVHQVDALAFDFGALGPRLRLIGIFPTIFLAAAISRGRVHCSHP
jgi:16S rRNA (adenine1518-N6/adenine1519-N6)-dimethyltransferase